MARLSLYRLTRAVDDPADLVGQVRQMIVAAASPAAALRLHPNPRVQWSDAEDTWVKGTRRVRTGIWPPIDTIKVTLIGTALPGQAVGVVSADTVSMPLLLPEHHVDALLEAWYLAVDEADEAEIETILHEAERLGIGMDLGEELVGEILDAPPTPPPVRLVPTPIARSEPEPWNEPRPQPRHPLLTLTSST